VMRRYRSVPILIGFGMILGGALGNLADRIWLGVVIDFIDIGIGELRWPVFNVADMGVTLGVLVLGIGLIREEAVAARREAPDDGVVEDREGDAASSYNA
jgi:signal peptidase II